MQIKMGDERLINSKLTLLVGSNEIKVAPAAPFNELSCCFCEELSRELMKIKGRPDIMTLAFWCRKAHIYQMKEQYAKEELRLGRGIVFHLAPSNVPINFIFSFLFGVLAGNSNIVRVPSKSHEQIDLICMAINKVLMQEKYKNIKEQTAFVRYDHDEELNTFFMKNSDAHMIWGGNATIAKMKKYPTKPRCNQVMFANRYSFSIINSDEILKLSEKELLQLAKNFYNDTYIMDQNGCSSPQLIVWVGNLKQGGKRRFWDAIYRCVKKDYKLEAMMVMDKYTQLCQELISLSSIKEIQVKDNWVYRIQLKELDQMIHERRGKSGYFYEYDARNIEEIGQMINETYQTVTYFGIDKQEIIQVIKKQNLIGIDRIVPVGIALAMENIWDGYDLINELSRRLMAL